MIAWKRVIAGTVLLPSQLAITACEDRGNSGSFLGPGATLTGVHVSVKTSEMWGRRNLMIVGEEGSVIVDCTWNHDRGGPCEPSPSFVSSAPAIVSASAHPLGVSATLRAHAPGTAVISARVRNITRDTTILVVSEPLPIDDLGVELGYYRDGWLAELEDWCPACQASYNPRLEKILMPAGGSVPFKVWARREGEMVFGLEFELASTAEGVAYPSKRCRPVALDPDCDDYAPHWVSALAPGTATVSVTARNLTISFKVEVTDSL